MDFGAEYEPELTKMWYKHNKYAMWEKLISGINNVCINLVPSKIVQCRADFIPYKNQEIIDQEEKNKIMFPKCNNLQHGPRLGRTKGLKAHPAPAMGQSEKSLLR